MYANTLSNLGSSLAGLGQLAEGEALQQQALAIFERTLNPAHPLFWATRVNLADVLVRLGQFDEAEVQLELADAIEKGSDDEVACVQFGFAELYAARGELERARAMHERALALRERSFEPDNLELADSMSRLGSVVERLGQLERARELYECALEIRTAIEGSASDLAEVRVALARVRGG
jgi:tetratricopeptide (TPR) repeat protein